MSEIAIPADALVVLVGASGAGKTTFAARHFAPDEILSSDAFRELVSGDAANQAATPTAFRLLHRAVRARLASGRLAVVDATNVTARARSSLLALARSGGRPVIAVVLDPGVATCLARNAARPGRVVEPAVVERQQGQLHEALARPGGLAAEGFSAVHRLTGAVTIDAATILLTPAGRTMAAPAGTLDPGPAGRSRTRRTIR